MKAGREGGRAEGVREGLSPLPTAEHSLDTVGAQGVLCSGGCTPSAGPICPPGTSRGPVCPAGRQLPA